MVARAVLAAALLGTAAANSGTKVATGEELVAALLAGAPHILITQHLDLRQLAPMEVTVEGPIHLVSSAATRTITVCPVPPSPHSRPTGR